ncbi:hypothetical protein H9L39_18363 [Fusarium oxysporum f. sp. albedinis]|nr:hypothetical protein H9L39_19437 [Fusarium oxysporum f. sp. albedinis]KAK2470215.1 hypothetical protein H9L39_18363 [Fusarium oxysporum f. sp. albedinis]
MRINGTPLAAASTLCATGTAELICKNHPSSADWPSTGEWDALNQTVSCVLIRSTPAASCYNDSDFSSVVSCENVTDNWLLSEFHAVQSESIGYSYWANNSCVPPNDHGYRSGQTCEIGATAMKWASSRNIRIVIKGKGHDLNGRSSGAYSLSIWTHRLRDMSFKSDWRHPSKNTTEHVVVAGSGNNWGDVLQAAYSVGRTVVLQATVVTTDGHILVANAAQNQDLLWAIRGGGPGLYGAVVENVAGLMDLGITGNEFAATSTISTSSNQSSVKKCVGLIITLYGYNTTTSMLKLLPEPTSHRMMTYAAVKGVKIDMAEPNIAAHYLSFFDVLDPNPSACSDISLISSRLLGHSQLTDLSLEDVQRHLYTIMNSQVEEEPSNMIIGLQGGPGPRDVSQDMRGGLNPAWRQAYLHVLSTGAKLNETNPNIQDELSVAAEWIVEHKEALWRKWAPGSGSYINKANPFNKNFKEDFYGASYDRLEVKQEYDPTNSLYVLSDVGSDKWQYDLNSGMLCAEN